MVKTDYLVIGGGIAGLVFALEAAKKGSVAVVVKDTLSDCNTAYAQGGIAAVLGKDDTFERHAQDTYSAGCNLGKMPVIRAIIEDGPAIIEYLIEQGTRFTPRDKDADLSPENLQLTREGAHSNYRVAFAADSTGREISNALIHSVKNHPNIQVFENHLAIDLITQHHIPQMDRFITRRTCWGAYVLTNTNAVEVFRAGKTMLATGGGGQVYAHTTNPAGATGDGYAMAMLAGARLANMEFIQFHPTAFFSYTGNTFLVSEALRGEGAVLRLPDGTDFMQRYHQLGSLAPRDVVARAIEQELNLSGEKCVYLDATGIGKQKLGERFPSIGAMCLQQGVDFTSAWIPVVPAAHYFCGGIVSTVDGLTDIKNLFTAGEVACTGLHGANRLASNSLLEAAVVAYRAAQHPVMEKNVEFPDIPEWTDYTSFNENEWVVISYNRQILRTVMNGYVGITRTRRLLKYAQAKVANVIHETDNFYRHNPVRREVIETRNLALTARAIVECALRRKESRGLHYIVDYPERDDANYHKDTIF